jgi:2-polyprenyl-3-methyl-5-hydroxy-6-metoxy-1,4-benzoquinol methylase
MTDEAYSTNYLKYRSGNPIVRWLINSYFHKLEELLHTVKYESLLDAGCGEGEALKRLSPVLPSHVEGFDVDPQCVFFCQERYEKYYFTQQNIYSLPWRDNEFDVVLCLEVLEHLERPDEALHELLRVSRLSVILSVPREPWFLLGNIFRGKYLSTWGNHPEHIQHWNPKNLRRFLNVHAQCISMINAFPWTIAYCTKQGS